MTHTGQSNIHQHLSRDPTLLRGKLMIKIAIAIIVVLPISGCTIMSINKDLSTTEETALIKGTRFGIGFGFGEMCRIIVGPIHADSLVVDIGPIELVASCIRETFSDVVYDQPPKLWRARFSFTAEEGHIYTFSGKTKDCLQLLDVTTDKDVIACEPFFIHGFEDRSTDRDTANIRIGLQSTRYHNNCWATNNEQDRLGFVIVNAGPTTIDAVCQKQGVFRNAQMTSRFDFDAEAGHTYALTAIDKECLSLLDITSIEVYPYDRDALEEAVIACEPYEEVE